MAMSCKFRHMLGKYLWTGRDLYRAAPAVTRSLGFCGPNLVTFYNRSWELSQYSNPDVNRTFEIAIWINYGNMSRPNKIKLGFWQDNTIVIKLWQEYLISTKLILMTKVCHHKHGSFIDLTKLYLALNRYFLDFMGKLKLNKMHKIDHHMLECSQR